MNLELNGRIVWVAGGSRGIGLGIVEVFLAEGAKVALTARTSAQLERVGADLAQKYGNDRVYVCGVDSTHAESVRDFVLEVEAKWGRIDVVVANVGSGRSVPDAIPSAEQLAKSWSINFHSAEVVARESYPALERSKGVLICISSIAGLEVIGAPTDYTIAKAALIAFCKTLSHKWAPRVRVNVVSPGNIFFEGGTWDQIKARDPQGVEELLNRKVPLRRFGNPEEIGNAVAFLSSKRAEFITGANLIVDGGQTIGL